MNFIEILKNLCPTFTAFGFLLISNFIHVNTCSASNSIPCKRDGSCRCVIEDPNDHSHTTEFSLWPFNGNKTTPALNTKAGSWEYTFNLCTGFTQPHACTDVCGCQVSTDDGPYTLALGTGPLFFGPYDYSRKVLSVTYRNATSKTGDRSMVVSLTHGNSETISVIEGPELHYKVSITSPKFVGHEKWDTKSISVGSIIVIVFFVALLLYVIAGILFMKYRREASGKELIPNVGFWSSLPGLIKDGCVFSCGSVKKICCKDSKYDEI